MAGFTRSEFYLRQILLFVRAVIAHTYLAINTPQTRT